MTIKPFFPVFIVLVGVVIWAQKNAEKPPEQDTSLTPKEYIQLVEERKAQRIEQRRRELQTPNTPPETPNRDQ
ncbi:MAG: hypothetical protein B0D96_05920 [Candidatus Sedimenticola endophacoides]|uniref:Uncharacterized protein n=1 Tax=Candidatus Sedimenticola endophacoides TaxID=2548426 RepID=A0A6N4E3R8_9GAMM|nr:MAG: hypothetical protein B0D94_07105 [Candidatus Sedimenticola endophacoides]OQX35784.1 MAG: hypothetical protein B0D96_05920 [Candidatus Sedimenticola endophacoides]OQX42289.1 MAG: hypothetical protein B0D89_01545 [Candidatus Sedimenticola endophacoides]PUE00816.1 MAG: hypothetical protein C3L26_04755 [Candidatus Sedimenticola endophacoides]PUE04255.1 MAG: hypothetical protein C3L25_04745 [Candidatus Sedimenticola endophacoides]